MSVDVGSVYSEIRIDIDKFHNDIKGVKDGFNNIEKYAESATETSEYKISKIMQNAHKAIEEINAKTASQINEIKKAEAEKIQLLKRTNQEAIDLIKGKEGLTKEEKQKEIQIIKDSESEKIREIRNSVNEQKNMAKELAREQINEIRIGSKNQIAIIENQGSQIDQLMDKMSSTGIGQFAKMMGGIENAIKAAPIIGLITGIVAGVKKLFSVAVDFINQTANAYQKHQESLAKLNSVLQATGANAWTSARQLSEMARELSGIAGKTTGEIMDMQAVLLGFPTITGEMFERASRAIIDMSAVMGTDLMSNVNMVGKALDTPVEGMSALSRQGFIFTAQEKEMIRTLEETGRHLEAQTFMVQTLEGVYKGAAEAISDVAASQGRLVANSERLHIALGSLISGPLNWYRTGIADIIGAFAGVVEGQAAIAASAKKSYESAEKYIKMHEERLKDMIEAADIAAQTDYIIILKMELNLEKSQDQIIGFEADLKRLQAQATSMNNENLEEIQNNIRLLQEHIATEKKLALEDEESLKRRKEAAAAAKEAAKKETANKERLQEQINKINAIEQNRIQTLQEIARAEEAGLIKGDAVRAEKQAAYQAEANAINTVISALQNLGFTNDLATENIDSLKGALQTASNEFNNLTDKIETITHIDSAKFNKFIDETEAALKRETDILQANRDAGLIGYEEFQQKLIAANKRAIDAITNFMQEADSRGAIVWAENEEALARVTTLYENVGQELDKIANKQQAAAQTKWLEEYKNKLQLIKATEKERLEIQQDQAEAQLRNSDVYKKAIAQDGKTVEQVQAEMVRLVRATITAKNEAKSENPYSGWIQGIQLVSQGMQAVGQLINTIVANNTRDQLAELEKLHKEEVRIMEEASKDKLDILEEDFQNRLYYAGVGKAATTEAYEADLEKAIATGDHRLIYRAMQAKKEFEIRDKYEKDKLAAEKEAQNEREEREQEYQRKRAELEHKAALTQWGTQLALTTASVAQAIMQALAQGGPYAGPGLAAIMSAIGAVQVAAVVAAKPQMQQFQDGGIVRGDPYRGDAQTIMARGREMVLTDQQQTLLWDTVMGGGRGGESQMITLIIEMDGETMANKIFDIGSNGNAFIRTRAVVR